MSDTTSRQNAGAPVIIIMGVTGSGKTTIGRLLGQRLGFPFYDADDFHSPSNMQKLADDIPLKDEDREPWLEELTRCVAKWAATSGAVLACSALKHSYRNRFRSAADDVRFVFLDGDPMLIAGRVAERARTEVHVIKDFAAILQGQFRDLEVPKDALRVDVHQTPEQIVDKIIAALEDRSASEQARSY